MTQVRTLLTQTLTSLLSSVVGLVGAVIILRSRARRCCSWCCVLAPALIVVAVVVGRPLQRLATQVQDALAARTTTAEEALGGIRVVKSFVREDWELHRYDTDLRGRGGHGDAAHRVARTLRRGDDVPGLRRRWRSSSGGPATRSSRAR